MIGSAQCPDVFWVQAETTIFTILAHDTRTKLTCKHVRTCREGNEPDMKQTENETKEKGGIIFLKPLVIDGSRGAPTSGRRRRRRRRRPKTPEDAEDAENAEDARRRPKTPKTPEDAEDARRRRRRRRPKTPKTPEDAEDARRRRRRRRRPKMPQGSEQEFRN